jgi:hypothetical protein
MAGLETFGNNKLCSKYNCKKCHFITSKKSGYDAHILTAKHNRKQTETEIMPIHNCEICNKNYQTRTGLWKHKKTCVLPKTTDNDVVEQLLKQNDEFKNIIMEQYKLFVGQIGQTSELQKHNQDMQKQNQEMQKQILDVCKNGIVNNSVAHVNSHNKTFNLQVFLNEDCKDAMNITDFVDSIQYQLADLEHMGQVGYVEGLSNIIIKNLKALDVTKRPVHCTDQKRETIYIKNEGVWSKEDDDNKILRKMIKSVAFRNSKNTRLFKEKHPDCITSESRYSDAYNKIVIEAMGGGSKCNDYDSATKIIRNIAKVMTIDKNIF